MTTPTPETGGQPDTQLEDNTEDQAVTDDADAAAGYRSVLDEEAGDELDPADPNRATDDATEHDPDANAGDPVDDDDVAAVNQALADLGGAR